MDIEYLINKMHASKTEEEKESIKDEIRKQFSSLPDAEREEVKRMFLASLDRKLEEAKEVLNKVDIAIEMAEISKYISLSSISKDYFGKSKAWLYQRINGYTVNGKPARFTEEERKRFSEALRDISRKLDETSFRIV